MKHLWNSQRLSRSQHPPSRSHSVWSWGERKEHKYLAQQNQERLSHQIKVKINKKGEGWRWTNEILSCELFKEETSQSTYKHSPWPESGCAFGDEIRWRNSIMKIQWWNSVTNIWWDLRLLGMYDAIFATLIIRQRCSAYWSHLW